MENTHPDNVKNYGAVTTVRLQDDDIDSTYSTDPGEYIVAAAPGTQVKGRSKNFSPDWTPFRNDPSISYTPNSTSGAVSWFNPTEATYSRANDGDLAYKWTSRGNRSGRHALVVSQDAVSEGRIVVPGRWEAVLRGIQHMSTTFPLFTNISYLTAIIFTLGSILFIISAFLNLLNYIPNTIFPGSTVLASGYIAFFGSLIFVMGNVGMVLESFNDNRLGCLGGDWTIDPSTKTLQHNHSCRANWIWFPTWKDIQTHYIHELAFLASALQLLSAIIFFISGISSLPSISNHLHSGLLLGVYWTPKLLGSLGFLVAGIMFTVETQKHWWKPALGSLGWYIGVWKVVGSMGFLMTASFGFNQAQWAQWQSAIACLWGSFAFLISSVLRWYEVLDSFPVEVGKGGEDESAKEV